MVDVTSSRVQNLEQEVQNYARTHPTDVPWISWTDSERWADNVFVIAAAPNANYDERLEGQVAGYYYGSRLHISEEGREEVWDVTELKMIERDEVGRVLESAKVASDYIGYQLDLPGCVLNSRYSSLLHRCEQVDSILFRSRETGDVRH